MENYIPIRMLGKGSFGSAWLVQRRSDKANFVAKEVRLAGMKPAERDSAKREIDVLRTLNHPNITRYVDHYERNGALYIVMEYANGGDLYTKIKQQKGARFSEKEILHYFSQLCLALLHLHEHHILHRDLKTQNVFITKDGVIKLGDFGISTILRNTFELKRTVCGTPYYFSPELCLNKPYNNKSDVWALGCILYELTTLTHAFDGSNMKALVQKILKGVYPPIHPSYSSNLSKLISAMLQIDPRMRPNVGQIIVLPYIRESLSNLQRAVEAAHYDHKPCGPSEEKEEQRDRTPQSDAVRLADEKRKEEQAKEMRLAKERQQLQQQMEQRRRENEERLRQLQAQRRQVEIEQNQKKKELEARVREQRRMVEKRAKAQALIHKQREEEWERNLQEQVEDYKRKQREQERIAREMAEQEALRERLFKNNNGDPRHPSPPRCQNNNNNNVCPEKQAPSAAAAAELYREMRRQAALNKQRMMDDMNGMHGRDDYDAVSIGEGGRKKTPPQSSPDNSRQNRINSLGKMDPGEAEEVRRQLYWQMRREAQENKRRALGLDDASDAAVPKPSAPLPQLQQPATPLGPLPPHSPHEPKRELQQTQRPSPPRLQPPQGHAQAPAPQKVHQIQQVHQAPPPPPPPQQQQKQLGETAKGVQPVVYAKRVVNIGQPPVSKPPVAKERKCVSASPDNGTALPEDDGAGRKRDEDYSALHTAIDAALTQDPQVANVKDFSDEAFPDTDPSKFMLDGQALVLPNVQATDPLMHRIESLRLFLEMKLGESALIASYRQMNNIATDDDEAMQRVADMLPEEQQKFIPLIAQLIVCEDAFNRQLLQ